MHRGRFHDDHRTPAIAARVTGRTGFRAAALSALAGLALVASAWGQQAPAQSITIYSSAQPGAINPNAGMYVGNPGGVPGFALVREDRVLRLEAGRGAVRITDVAAQIDPTTVSFRSLTDPQTRVVDQSFQFDLVSPAKLLERYVDQEVTVYTERGQESAVVRGTLLSARDGQLVVSGPAGITIVNQHQGISLGSLPQGLITRPTLVWDVLSPAGGEQTARITYQTGGIAWWADYNLIFAPGANPNVGTVDVSAWVSILNQSGATYQDAQLKLVAGDVQRVQPPMMQRRFDMEMAPSASRGAPAFEERAFFEYHLYTLSEPTTIPDNSTKQLELFPVARDVPVEKILVYDGLAGVGWWGGVQTDQGFGVETKTEVDVYLRLMNDEASGLGRPLPAGRVRVSQVDERDGGVEFVGEDTIKHTPRDERVQIRLGSAFDVVGERIQQRFSVDADRRTMQETIRVTVRNRKDEPVRVVVQERMLRALNWEFVGPAPQHDTLDARTVHMPLDIDARGEKSVTFTVRYTW